MSAAVHRFIRFVPVQNLQDSFVAYAPQIAANTDWKQDDKKLRRSLIKSVESATDKELATILANIERIDEMSDEIGQAALLSAISNKTLFSSLPDPHTRADWALRHEPDAFFRAESICYADGGRDNRRIYSGFHIKPGLKPNTDEVSTFAFEDAISKLVGNDRKVKLDRFERERTDAKGIKISLCHYTIYYETLPQTTKVFNEADNIEPVAIKPAREAALVFDSSSGLIEVLCDIKEIRVEIARAFVSCILKSEDEAESVALREYDLDRLLRPHAFSRDPEDCLASVKVDLLRMRDIEGKNNRIQVSLASDETRSLYDYCRDRFGSYDPTRNGSYASMASITIRKQPPQGRKRGKTIHLKLTYPNGCDLSGRPESERNMLEKYLAKWELVRAV